MSAGVSCCIVELLLQFAPPDQREDVLVGDEPEETVACQGGGDRTGHHADEEEAEERDGPVGELQEEGGEDRSGNAEEADEDAVGRALDVQHAPPEEPDEEPDDPQREPRKADEAARAQVLQQAKGDAGERGLDGAGQEPDAVENGQSQVGRDAAEGERAEQACLEGEEQEEDDDIHPELHFLNTSASSMRESFTTGSA